MEYSLNDLLSKYQLKAKKTLGQNWLIDKNVINKIINILNPQHQDIIEVGPGLGALTFLLIQVARSVTAYEIDLGAIEILTKELPCSNLELIHQDFLQAKFDWSKPKPLIGNIPYYITSDIIFKILNHQTQFSKVVLTIQDEVANRMVAQVGSKDYGKLTVSLNALGLVKKHFVIKPHQFYPAPKVNSAVISFDLYHHLDQKTINDFLLFIKQCFAFRRKTLVNNLIPVIKNKNQIETIINNLNLNLNIRPQELTHQQFFELFKLIHHIS